VISPAPALCEQCPTADRQLWGCGCSSGVPWTATAAGLGYAGEADADYQGPEAEDVKERRTCPQYFARSPFVRSILDDLDDYEAGRLDLRDMGAADLFYLRVALAERRAWQSHYQHELNEQARAEANRG